ncbi:hypothetical protein [Anianabacter salinae]|uniref:hypothetical protein n=1 Tax=Anianabacter salinae TaxID=2851023 RepID=UPI00225E0A2E|nr:hypothetical protein [Anianabacter salinae]MBV0913932.1 hypothetical protein [Anianabacter salinae]
MARHGWHIHDEGGVLTLSRSLAPRLDVVAASVFPPVSAYLLAQQVRQDLWRRLRAVRGFAPVVRVSRTSTALTVEAGGGIASRSFPKGRIEQDIADLLASAPHRARWIAHARRHDA